VPEGDTVYITAQRLRRALVGHEVTRFDLRVPALALADLRGTEVLAVEPVGKHLLIRFSNTQTLHSHLRMDGAWRVGPAHQRPRGGPEFAVRALVGNADWLASGIRVHDLALLPTDNEAEVIGHLGPDLVTLDADLDEALNRYASQPGRPIGEALLDQRLAAGIGNVYKSELLFLHRLDPWSKVSDVPDLRAVLVDAARLLRANLSDFNRSTTGWHQRGQQYWVYGRGGKACRRCGGAIAKDEGDAASERLTYYCPRCQNVAPGPHSATSPGR
jgi:formamidopyrimidine-DNA glycosylase